MLALSTLRLVRRWQPACYLYHISTNDADFAATPADVTLAVPPSSDLRTLSFWQLIDFGVAPPRRWRSLAAS